MKKRIGIDARLIKQTGVGVYTQNLLSQLEKIAPDEIEFHIYQRSQDMEYIAFKRKNFIKIRADFTWHTFNEQIGFLRLLNRENIDLMHFTYFSYPLFYKKPFVMTIHDLIPYTHTTGKASTKNPLNYFIKKSVYRWLITSAVKNSIALITPTQTIKDQIVQTFGEQYEQKITVTYEGVNQKLIEAKPNMSLTKQFKQPFFIYIGNFYPHKNVENLIRAFTHTHIDSRLILIGPEDFFAQRMRAVVDEENQRNRITFFHNATLSDMAFFYQNAQGLIHPSYAEGFGLPLVEAVHFGCPIIASNIPVFRELLENKYDSFDPTDIYEMARVIDSFSKKKPTLKTKFSFEKLAKETLRIYENSLSL